MSEPHAPQVWADAVTSIVSAAGALFVYRELGPRTGVPLVALTHLGANLDSWDPRVVDGLARERHVVALGYRGVGGSTGRVRDSIDEMAADVVAVLRALGLDQVDLFGLSMGGMVGQAVAVQAPDLVQRVVLAGSGPAGGPGLTRMSRVMVATTLRAVLVRKDPRELLFFTQSPTGRRAARDYLARLTERTAGRERAVGPAVLRAQLAAVRRWGGQAPPDILPVAGPALVVHGDSDRMVPPENLRALAGLLPGARVEVLQDASHGAVFQHHREVVAVALDLLRR